MDILISGSIAYDRIMDFPGRFQDHILPEKLHILNVSFMVNGLEEKFGGTAGNIAYNVALMGERATLLSSVGRDFERYGNRLRELDISLDGLLHVEDELTAGAYITTDKADNQITGFNPGAMKFASNRDVSGYDPANTLAIIAPGNTEDMTGYAAQYKQHSIPYIFDPGQQIPAIPGADLEQALTGAAVLVSNDYELEMILKRTDLSRTELLGRVGALVTTLGEQGAVVIEGGRKTKVPAAKPTQILDPTGAGDAFRAGLIKGMVEGRTLTESAALGATVAVYCVEKYGTQEHSFDQEALLARFEENFGPLSPI